jgi:hypothetical protein
MFWTAPPNRNPGHGKSINNPTSAATRGRGIFFGQVWTATLSPYPHLQPRHRHRARRQSTHNVLLGPHRGGRPSRGRGFHRARVQHDQSGAPPQPGPAPSKRQQRGAHIPRRHLKLGFQLGVFQRRINGRVKRGPGQIPRERGSRLSQAAARASRVSSKVVPPVRESKAQAEVDKNPVKKNSFAVIPAKAGIQ